MNVVSLIGARPQYVKEAIVRTAFDEAGIKEVLVDSGQHYSFEMSDIFFKTLKMKAADYNLGVGSDTHAKMTAKIMSAFEEVLLQEKPALVLVYGDTNTTIAGALVAAKMKIPIAHVEAGIRMKPRDMPEEINRVLTDRISALLFCPSEHAVKNLLAEGIRTGVHFTGDVMYDLFVRMKEHFSYDTFDSLGVREGSYILMTMHRDYNVDERTALTSILAAVEKAAEKTDVVFPMHPRTKKRIEEYSLEKYLKNVRVLEPLDYPNLMGLLMRAQSVLTDSGGLQKEAYFADKRAAVLMPDTGWVELIDAGQNVLCDANTLYDALFTRTATKSSQLQGIYGNAAAGEKIAEIVRHFD